MKDEPHQFNAPYISFFKGLLDKFHSKTGLFSKVIPNEKEWVSEEASSVGGWYYCILLKKGAKVQLSFWKAMEEPLFDELKNNKAEIEREFGEHLDLIKVDNKIAYHVVKRFDEGGRDFPDTWPEVQDKMVEAMIRFNRVLGSRLDAMGNFKK